MAILFEPLKDAGINGIQLTSGDGVVRMVHPILAAYVADYPEQCLVTCSKYGTCPKCWAGATELDDDTKFKRRTPKSTLDAMAGAKASTSSRTAYIKACNAQNVNGTVPNPFWEGLPYTNVHLSQTPDVLHQLYQGVLKHLLEWCQTLMTEQELDRRIQCLPPAIGVRHFKNGLSALSQISGSERKNMGKILLGCIADELDSRAVTACRSILDFIYLAQYPTHDDETLGYMDAALQTWRDNKSYFVDVGIRDHFNIPKFHSLVHYVEMIRLFGTTNNYNTEMFERLHIDYSKKGWRASNKRDEFPQMTEWITRKESVHGFQSYLQWVDDQLSMYSLHENLWEY